MATTDFSGIRYKTLSVIEIGCRSALKQAAVTGAVICRTGIGMTLAMKGVLKFNPSGKNSGDTDPRVTFTPRKPRSTILYELRTVRRANSPSAPRMANETRLSFIFPRTGPYQTFRVADVIAGGVGNK